MKVDGSRDVLKLLQILRSMNRIRGGGMTARRIRERRRVWNSVERDEVGKGVEGAVYTFLPGFMAALWEA